MTPPDPAAEDAAAPAPQGLSVHRRLLEDIRLGLLAPGDRLRETELAARLGVSRTPIREAIRQLEADGLVTHAPRLGATVREITLPDLPVDEILGALNVESAAVFEALTLSNRDDLMRRQVNEAWPNALRQSWYFSAVDFMQGERLRRRVMEQTHEFFDQVDVVCGPSFGTPMLSLTNLTGQPCLAMRAGFEEARTRPLFEHPENEDNPTLYRVPRSISLMSNLFDEGKIFTVGRALEAALSIAAERPPIA